MGNNAKLLIVTLLATFGLIIGVSVIFSRSNTTQVAQPVDQALLTEGEQVHTKGSENPTVTIVEFADFQCPYCAASAPSIDQILAAYPDVQFVFRHYPLLSIHPNALPSARAAEAAGQQGKFWEMHDALYATQEEWADDTDPSGVYTRLAGELNLDLTAFQAAYEDQALRDKVYTDLRLGEKLGVASTPTFYYNGQPMDLNQMITQLSIDFSEVSEASEATEATEGTTLSR